MKGAQPTRTLFLDIGGVLLTDGWNHHARKRAATHLKLEWSDMEEGHRLNFATSEEGKLTLVEYLSRVIFHKSARSLARNSGASFLPNRNLTPR